MNSSYTVIKAIVTFVTTKGEWTTVGFKHFDGSYGTLSTKVKNITAIKGRVSTIIQYNAPNGAEFLSDVK